MRRLAWVLGIAGAAACFSLAFIDWAPQNKHIMSIVACVTGLLFFAIVAYDIWRER